MLKTFSTLREIPILTPNHLLNALNIDILSVPKLISDDESGIEPDLEILKRFRLVLGACRDLLEILLESDDAEREELFESKKTLNAKLADALDDRELETWIAKLNSLMEHFEFRIAQRQTELEIQAPDAEHFPENESLNLEAPESLDSSLPDIEELEPDAEPLHETKLKKERARVSIEELLSMPAHPNFRPKS